MTDYLELEQEYSELHSYLQGQLHALQEIVRILHAFNTGSIGLVDMDMKIASLYACSLRKEGIELDFGIGERDIYRRVFVDLGYARKEAS